MAIKCSNCGTSLGCACQQRVANDNTSCCSNCVAAYNAQHPVAKPAVIKQKQSPAPSSGNFPTEVTVVYRGPGHQV